MLIGGGEWLEKGFEDFKEGEEVETEAEAEAEAEDRWLRGGVCDLSLAPMASLYCSQLVLLSFCSDGIGTLEGGFFFRDSLIL